MNYRSIALALLVSCAAMPASAEMYGPPAPVMSDDYRLPPEMPAVEVYGPPAPLRDDRPFLTKIGPRKHLAHALAAGLDAYSTYRCSTKKRTCEEGNPAVRTWTGKHVNAKEAVGIFVVSEVVYLAGSYVFGEWTGYDSTASTALKVGLTVGHGAAVVVNVGY